MRASVVTLSLLAMAVGGAAGSSSMGRPVLRTRAFSECLSGSASDSGYFLEFVRSIANPAASAVMRLASDLPAVASDSIRIVGTPAQCDSVAVRYRQYYATNRGDTTMPLLPVMIARVAPNRFVADPRVSTASAGTEWITLDSTMHIVKVWRTFP